VGCYTLNEAGNISQCLIYPLVGLTYDLEESLTRDNIIKVASEIIQRQSAGLDIARFISENLPGEKGDAAVSKFAGREDLKVVFQILQAISAM
jgi:hypothetical protein